MPGRTFSQLTYGEKETEREIGTVPEVSSLTVLISRVYCSSHRATQGHIPHAFNTSSLLCEVTFSHVHFRSLTRRADKEACISWPILYIHSFIHFFIFGILLRVVMHPDVILEILGTRFANSPDGMPIYHRAPSKHIHSHIEAIYNIQSTYWHAFGMWQESRDPGNNPGHEEDVQNFDGNLKFSITLGSKKLGGNATCYTSIYTTYYITAMNITMKRIKEIIACLFCQA